MVAVLLPFFLHSANADDVTSGQCGDNLYWSFDAETGTLTITGRGDMWGWEDTMNFSDSSDLQPWFKFRKNINTVRLPEALTSIGKHAFCHCSSLNSITLPNNLVSIDEGAFWYCTAIETVELPNSVVSLGHGAFQGCSNLRTIRLSENLTSIGHAVFCYCSKLISMDLPNGITEIPPHTFCGCTSLASITIPDSVACISFYAFFQCSSLQSIFIPASVTEIVDDHTFAECTNLKEFVVDDNNNSYKAIDGVLYDFDQLYLFAYPAGKQTNSYAIIDGVQRIGYTAFQGSENLITIAIPNSVSYIDDNAFYGCTNLETLELPDHITSIPEWCCYNCKNLKSVSISKSVTKIGSYAFFGCDGLSEVYYSGSASQAAEISVEDHNEELLNAFWHYGSADPVGNGDYYDLQYGKYKYTYDSNYFQRPSYSPDNALAMFAGILSMAVYHDDGKRTIREVYSDLEIPEEDYYDNSYDRDKDLRFSIAVKKIHIDGEEYVLLMLSMRGTVHIWSEGIWRDHFANADVDLAFAPYKAYDCIDEFRRNVMSQLYLFVETHPEIMTSKLKVLITGHSLGGAAANLIGAQFNSFILNGGFYNLKERSDIFVYTFGAIDSIDTPVTINAGYENIHNITNYYDNFGPNGWAPVASAAGNTRYGKFGNIDIFYEDKDNGAFGIEHQMNHSMYETYLEAVYNGNVRYHREGQDYYVCCPVDVRVYDGETLVCEVVNETINRDTTSIPVIVYEQRKVFHLPDDKEYRIEISARDAGSMIYQIKDIATGVSEKRYADVALTENKQFASIVGGDIEAEDVTLYVVNEDGEPIGEVHEDGTETPIVLLGDADGDHAVTAADAALILRYLVKLDALSEFQRSCADVNGDGVIDATDASKLLRRLVGLEK